MNVRSCALGVALGLTCACSAQLPRELVRKALANRDAMKSADFLRLSVKDAASSQGAYPATRLEFGGATRPDVGGGEDLTLFQPLDIFGKSKAAGVSGSAAKRSAEANYRLSQLAVQHDVLTAYANWANTVLAGLNAKEQLRLARAVLVATQKKVEARALPEIATTRAELDVDRASQADADRSAAIEAAAVRLVQTVGSPGVYGDTRMPAPLDPDLLVKVEPGKTRPELLILAAQRDGFRADGRSADLSRLPDIELQARRSPWSSDAQQYGLRLQFVLPLFDNGAARSRSLAARHQALSAEFAYSDTQKRIEAEINVASIQMVAAQKSLAGYEKLAAAGRLLLGKTQRGYELGANTLIDVIDAERALSDSLALLASARLTLDLAVEASLAAQGQLLVETPR